ncbi:MAG: hypothetical protein GYB68_19155 [Chloroflexi bacterium]|nr:hypothetical protein [Chloroflexota bacterium]
METTESPSEPYYGQLGAFIRRNPVALKELRGRMRGVRTFIILTIFVGLMSAFAVVLYLVYTASNPLSLSASGGAIGKLIFGGVVAVELFLVCFISPAFTAGAISSERERQTYDLLRTTLLPARRLVAGKLLAALAFVVLLLVVAIPLQSLAFLMGGVIMTEVILSIVLLITTAVGYGAVGIYFSARTQKTLSASVLTYTFALFTTVALPLVTLALVGFMTGLTFAIDNALIASLWEALAQYIALFLSATNPISASVLTEIVLLNQGTIGVYSATLSNGTSIPLVSPWILYILLYTLATLVMIRATVKEVQKVDV